MSCSVMAVMMIGFSNLAPPDALQARFFQLKRYSAEAAVAKLRRALGNGPDVKIASDRTSNLVLLQTTSAKFQQAEAIIRRLEERESWEAGFRSVRLGRVPASLAGPTIDFVLRLKSIIAGDDASVRLVAFTRINAIIVSADSRSREQEAKFLLNLLDLNLWELYGDAMRTLATRLEHLLSDFYLCELYGIASGCVGR